MSHQSELISTDIDAYLAQHESKELLRFLTCGSVDDGKSTLIGRLLHDSQMIYEDQLEAIKSDSVKSGTTGDAPDLALLVDGLQAEREQGITIDVAYRYFSTARRKFIIADTPGHEQYTRNMATGASTCDLAVILIDARHGVQTQTRRHSFITSLLGIRHTLIAVNKMDLVDYSQARFDEIRQDFQAFAARLGMQDLHFVPISALKGDNVVNLSAHMPWYQGQPLMDILESVEIARDRNLDQLRFPVQYVNRPHLDFRGYCGTLAAGRVRPGDNVSILPSGQQTRIARVLDGDGELDEAFAPMAVTLTLADEVDVSRGDVIVHSDQLPPVVDRFNAHLVWMGEKPLEPGREYLLKTGTRSINARVTRLDQKIDVNSLEETPAERLTLNEIARCEITADAPLVCDHYDQLPGSAAFILIDRFSHLTVAGGMMRGPATSAQAARSDFRLSQAPQVSTADRARRLGQQPAVLSLVAAQQRDALTAAYSLEKLLFDQGRLAAVLDADRQDPDRLDSLAEVLESAGLIVLVAGAEPSLGNRVLRQPLDAEDLEASVLAAHERLRQAGCL